MFTAKHNNPDKLLKIFKMIEDVSSEVTFRISSEEISIENMDDARVSLIKILLDCDDFNTYIYNDTKEHIDIGINVKMLCKIFGACERVDTVEFRLSSYDTDTLVLCFDNENRTSEFSLKLINTEYMDVNIVDIDYSAEIEISMKRLTKLFQELEIVESDVITFNLDASCEDKSISISSEGDNSIIETILKHYIPEPKTKTLKIKDKDGGYNTKVIKSEQEAEYYVYPFKKSLTISFSHESIKKIIKLSGICDKSVIGISENTPIKFLCMLSDNSHVQYYVAPKV